MRLVLMGTGPFAVPTFQWLAHSPYPVVAVVTRPVKEEAARRKGPANPVRDLFAARDVPLLSPPDVNAADFVQQLHALQPDVLVVCDFGQILAPETLATASRGGVNLHGSLLPKYRGAAPINWAIWNGETETGVTVIHMTPRLDAGPCLTRAQTEIQPEEDAVALEKRLSQVGIEPVAQALEMLEHWDGSSPLGEMQDPTQATKAPRLKKSDGRVDWSQSAVQITRQVRALRPWPGTYTDWRRPKGPLRLILERVAVAEDVKTPATAQPGEILEAHAERVVVATGCEALAVLQLQPAGKVAMSVAEFLRGYPPRPGEVLG